MRSPLMQVLDAIVMMDAHDTRKVRDMADAHLRDLEGPNPDAGYDAQCEAKADDDNYMDWRTGLNQLRRFKEEGAELQRGLEAAVLRERERLDGPDDAYDFVA